MATLSATKRDDADGADQGETRRGIPKEWLLHIWCTPTKHGRSNQFVVPRWNFGRRNPAWKAADALNIVVLNEDKRNVETAWQSQVPASAKELSMPTDASTIAFQRYHWNTFGKRPLNT